MSDSVNQLPPPTSSSLADRPARAAGSVPGLGSADRVELHVPADPAYLAVLRTATAGLAARLDLTLDEIEDLRIAVDEACALVLGPQPLDATGDPVGVHPSTLRPVRDPGDARNETETPQDATLSAIFDLTDAALVVDVSGPATSLPRLDSFAWAVLEALVGSLETGRDARGRHRIRLTHDSSRRGR